MAPKATLLQSLIHRCRYTLKKVQNLYATFANEIAAGKVITAPIIAVRANDLHRYQEAYTDLYSQILQNCPGDEYDEYDKQLDEFEQICSDIRLQIETLAVEPKEENLKANNANQIVVNQPHLQVPIPKFDGNYEQWPKFKAMFTDIMGRTKSSDAIKLYHLNQALTGQAASVINASIITENNFNTAWKLLEARFENPRVIVESHLNGLFSMKRVDKENARDLRALLETCRRHIDGLQFMKYELDKTSNLIITKLVTSCVDTETRKLWERSLYHGEFPELESTLKFITTQCEVLERCDDESKPSKASKAKVFSATKQENSTVCAMCSGDHKITKCSDFLQLGVNDRFAKVKQLKLCLNCLTSSHRVTECKSKWTCYKCHSKHHTLLHREKVEAITQQPNESGALSLQCSGNEVSSTVFLSTVVLLVRDKSGNEHEARALLDSGSQLNFISGRLAQVLRLPRTAVHISVSGIGSAIVSSVQQQVTATVRSRHNNYEQAMKFAILAKPTTNLPVSNVDISRWTLPRGIVLADPMFHKSSSVDMILGAEYFGEILREGKIMVAANQPMLLETEFGWVVSGNSTQQSNNTVVCSLVTIEELMERFFEIEEVKESNNWSTEEAACENHYKTTTTRAPDGRYIVQLPRKPETINTLGESKSIALRRFLANERKLQRNPATKAAYTSFMDEYISLGHMSPIQADDKAGPEAYYLPHHAVFKADSTTTKCRVVFDASAKTSTGVSLNDTLMVGPTIQQDASIILTRFRTYKIAITADVAKMYRQVWIHPKDRPLQRILWRSDPSEPIQTFELNTVTYGTASAPFLAIRSLQQVVKDHGSNYPSAASRIDDFYVDDFISGGDSVQDVLELRTEAEALFAEGGFPLRKWTSNDPDTLQDSSEEELGLSTATESDDCKMTLGLVWKPSTDIIRCKFNQSEVLATPTKRTVLSYIARIYDPLGIIEPVKATAKQIMQSIWALKTETGTRWDWDDELPKEIQQTWRRFQEQLQSLQHIEKICCDASEKGYGACCYVRTTSKDGLHTIRLLIAKSKVAPLSTKHSIARLELCAALLAGQLYKHIIQAVNLTTDVTFWTDSMTVFHWLQSPPSRWKTFVANRVSQIQQTTQGKPWNHVPGIHNPADLVSRGCLGTDLFHNQLWWQGPLWLAGDEIDWPKSSTVADSTTVNAEERTTTVSYTVQPLAEAPLQYIFQRYSSLSKLRRCIGYWMKYMHRLATKTPASEGLSVQDLDRADRALCRLAQAAHFQPELKTLKNKAPLPKSSTMRWFNPILSSDGIIRIGGRLNNSMEPEDVRHPIIVPGKHIFASLLVQHYHEKLLHAGPRLMLNSIRQRYWILGGRDLVKRVYHQCHICFRCRPSQPQTLMADLPTARVTEARPFSVSGVDYCGPVYVKGKHRKAVPTKAFVAIFVCFATRAVHIELVSDLTTEAFIAALRRFVARRGLVSELHSDNGTNFKGAANALHHLYKLLHSSGHKQAIQSWTLEKGIKWKFIPPRAPHFGGLWEAAVRSMKHHLVRVIGNSSFSFEDMATLLAEIECCLNSRPITALSDEPTDMEALTPGHFLTGSNLQSVPELDLRDIPENRLHHWQQVQQRVRRFWDRWHIEYLQQLQPRTK